jgi:hypothetical protein
MAPPDWYTRVVHMLASHSWKHPDTGFYWSRKRVPDATMSEDACRSDDDHRMCSPVQSKSEMHSQHAATPDY